MANPLLIIGGVVVATVVSGFGILAVPGWVAHAQDAAAVKDLSQVRQAQSNAFTLDKTYETTLASFSDKDWGVDVKLSQGVKLVSLIGSDTAWCAAVQSASGKFFAATEKSAAIGSGATAQAALDAAKCGPEASEPKATPVVTPTPTPSVTTPAPTTPPTTVTPTTPPTTTPTPTPTATTPTTTTTTSPWTCSNMNAGTRNYNTGFGGTSTSNNGATQTCDTGSGTATQQAGGGTTTTNGGTTTVVRNGVTTVYDSNGQIISQTTGGSTTTTTGGGTTYINDNNTVIRR